MSMKKIFPLVYDLPTQLPKNKNKRQHGMKTKKLQFFTATLCMYAEYSNNFDRQKKIVRPP